MHGWKRRATAIVLVSLVAGCGSQSTPTGAPGPSGPAASGAAAASGALSLPPAAGPLAPGPLDPAAIEAVVPAAIADPNAMGQQAADLGAQLRARINATAAYGQTATDLEAQLDQSEAATLQKGIDKAKAASGHGDVAPVRLAAWRPPVGPVAQHHDMALLGLAWTLLLVFDGVAIGEFNPQAGDIPPTSFTESEDIPAGTGSLSTRITLTFSSTGGVETIAIVITGNGSKPDATTGKNVTINGDSSVVVSINPCPDPAGHVSGTIGIGDDETLATAGGPTVGYKVTGTSDYVTTVNDQADIADTQVTVKWDQSVTTTTGSDSTAIDIAASGTDSFDGSGGKVAGRQSSFNVDHIDGPAQDSDGLAAGKAMALFGFTTPIIVSNLAKDVWRGGKCFQVRPAPDGGDVGAGSVTPVEVKVYHWVDKADIQVPVKATLTGTKAIDPGGQPVQSPAQFKFTAGKPLSTGDVEFKVTSNRGIGSQTSKFKVLGGLTVDIAGTYKESFGPGTWDLKVTANGIQVVAAEDGSVTATGSAKVKGTVQAMGGICRGTINESIGVRGAGQLQGPEDAQVYHVLIGPESTNNLGEVFSCPGVTVPSNQGDFFGQWSSTLGYVDLPATGGVVDKSGTTATPSRQAKGTFTATPH